MTLKRIKVWSVWREYLFLLCILLGGIAYSVFFRTPQNTPQEPVLQWVWARLEEKIPHHHHVEWLRTLNQYRQFSFETNTAMTFTIHPGLLDTQRNNGNYLLSGHLSLHSEANYADHVPDSTWTMHLSWHIQALQDDALLTAAVIDAQIQFRRFDDGLYVLLENITYTPVGESLDSLDMRYRLLRRYTDTWIRMDTGYAKRHHLFSPSIIQQLIEDNAQKVRLLPTPDDQGMLYSISGSTAALSGTWVSSTANTYGLYLREHDRHIIGESTESSEVQNIQMRQYNAYGGVFDGILRQQKKRWIQEKIFDGELLFPGWVWMDIQHIITAKKLLQRIPIDMPEQFLERSTIREQWGR